MNPENILAGTASLFMALGDKTRLRLLNLMRDREICVSTFTGTLGHSQPLISRHLAYLRNSGIVEARRDGKWMHYSLSKSLDENTSRLMVELFRWMETHEELRADREKHREFYGAPDEVAPVVPKPKSSRTRQIQKIAAGPEEPGIPEPSDAFELGELPYEHSDEDLYDPPARHNELEDFLL